ncbi:hypothetical protein B0J13DRAFT_679976 [Dactylonectria estremocensis]|uniref:Uncharacterized protein n=1 Tax=Dactylonectria estremocensis TaxID=1079267 RepID=A0A9P9DPF3_9HYPO|nr:hypothetical protein B0J13DRAFT_679976 [Dactylonectria estremocensis]
MSSIWLVTGTTSGIGEALVQQILSRGDKVIASGRKVEQRLGPRIPKSENLAFLELDITAGQQQVEEQIKKAWAIFGSIDVLVNNAGRAGIKTAEEADDDFVNQMFQVNVFGQMRVTRAILPLLRAQGHGCIAFTSSSSAWAPLPYMSHYGSSKAALSAYIEGLHKETTPLGIRCVAIECGGAPTSLGQPREEGKDVFVFPAIEGYLPLFGELMERFAKDPLAVSPGDVTKIAKSIVEIVQRDGVAEGRPWPIRVPLGSDGWGYAHQKCEEHLKVLNEWKSVAFSTDRDGPASTAIESMHKFTTILE